MNALDLERLAPHEFLNDNIIGFYIRFLEDHLQRCNAEVAKRVYFFNSYFFARLTNSPRGRRSINYEGVEKWTRSVDLFSYDYIIIPINEDAHWYLAIICNLPYLEGIMDESKFSASQRLGDTQEIPETPEPPLYGQEGVQHDTKEETTRQSLASMDISDKQGVHEEGSKRGQEDWPEYEENPDLAPAKISDFSSQPQPDSQKSAGSPKKSRKPKKRAPTGMKYDACQPIVITFDSLNQSRSSTISNLREYLSAEAKSKRGIEINKTLIKGMTAKEIPQQPNFSDCGLYLLAYLEKFVQNPDIFTRRLLRKEMRSIEDWPPLQSGLLRTRLRKFMELLYNEQEQLTKAEADRDMLMVDQQPISYLLGTPATDVTKEKVKNEKRNSPDVQVERSPSPSAKTTKPDRRREPSSVPPKSPEPDIEHGQNAANAETQESVVLIDHKPRSHSTPPRRDAQDQPAKRAVVEVPDSQDQASRPTDAAKIIEPRPLQRQRKRADTVYVDGDGVVEDSAPGRKETGAQRAESTGVEIQVRGTPPPNAK